MSSHDKIVNWVYDAMLDNATPLDIHIFKNHTEEDLVEYHQTMGRYIRYEHELWARKWTPEIGIDGVDYSPNHPDNYSIIIIRDVWKKINEL